MIATYHAGIPEVVKSGKTGILVPERNEDALLEAMQTLVDNPDRYSGGNILRLNKDGPLVFLDQRFTKTRQIGDRVWADSQLIRISPPFMADRNCLTAPDELCATRAARWKSSMICLISPSASSG